MCNSYHVLSCILQTGLAMFNRETIVSLTYCATLPRVFGLIVRFPNTQFCRLFVYKASVRGHCTKVGIL